MCTEKNVYSNIGFSINDIYISFLIVSVEVFLIITDFLTPRSNNY